MNIKEIAEQITNELVRGAIGPNHRLKFNTII